jgi:gluconate 5-dehydrogenase
MTPPHSPSNLPQFSLRGRTALITGASRGLGRAIALAFAAAGARLALVGREKSTLEAVGKESELHGSEVHCFPYDLAKVEGIAGLFAEVEEATGGPDILVNVAGRNFRGPSVDFPLTQWQGILDLNLTVPFVLSQCFARPLMAAGKAGKIVNIASLLTERGRALIAAYTASKGGIGQLTKALAVEWAPHKINVNAVGPGYFRTELTRPLYEDPAFNRWVLEKTPMGRWGEPSDLAGAAVFLASPAADFITGQTLYVDGGWLAHL